MKKLKLLLKIIAGLVVCLVVAVVIFIKSVNINEYKPKIENAVSSALNRQFVIAQDIELGLSLSPTIILKDISLSNPEWAKNKNMATLKEARIELSLLNLLYGKVYVSEVTIDGLNIYLEVNKDGQNSWTFDTAAAKDGTKTKNTDKFGNNFVITYDFGEIALKNSSVNYIDDMSSASHAVKINNISVKGTGALSLDAAYNDITLALNGTFPDLVDLLNGDEKFAFDLKSTIDNKHNIFVAGVIDDIQKLSGINITVSLKGDYAPHLTSYDISAKVSGNMEQLSVNDIKLNAEKKDEYNAKASGSISDVLNIKGINLKVNADAKELKNTPLNPISAKLTVASGKSDKQFIIDSDITANQTNFRGKIDIDISKDKPYISANMVSDYFSLEDIINLSSNDKKEASVSQDDNTDTDDEEEKLFLLPSEPLPLDSFGLVNADIKLNINNAVVTGTAKKASADVNASLKDSVLKASFDLKERENKDKSSKTLESLTGKFTINAVNPDSAEITANLNGKDILTEEILQQFISDKLRGGTLNLSADIKTTGNSVHQLAANLNGNTTLLFENASVSNNMAMKLGGDVLAQILNLLKIDFTKKETSEQLVDLQCAVVNLDFKDGLASFNNKIAIETDKMFATVSGDLNLGTERMDLSLSIDSQEGLKLGLFDTLANLIKIKGTFSEPSVGISAIGMATTAATVGAAIMTGGLSFVGQSAYEMAKPNTSPCSYALGKPVASSKFSKKKAEPSADSVKPEAAKQNKEETKALKLLKGIAESLKKDN